ncbi:hypothetical protein [Cupriavidus plantarum]|uniref:Uncharacterized protein n=1 Tax=Cupriavidus plantarum TaxID=942865 RepID=A0A316ES02_9BURK|nr:hypothetical protein [Cupriavidus plantarum]PWK35001.1 hypothetical protein C7419_102276 [Cupriavidus plantarum]
MHIPISEHSYHPTAQEPACTQHEHARSGAAVILRRAAISGASASLVSTGILALAGVRDCASAVAPINAVSHWLWADRAFRRHDLTVAHTVMGYVIHHAMSVMWAAGYEGYLAWRNPRESLLHAIGAGVAFATVAAVVDLRLTPERLTPGFERKLAPRALLAVYVGFGLALSAVKVWNFFMGGRQRDG